MWDTFNGILDQGVSRNPEIDEDFMHTDLYVSNPMTVEHVNWPSLVRTNNTKSFFYYLRCHLMNSMVLTSGEVTGLSQDRVSKQDTVAGKHRSKCCDELIPQ